MRLAYRCGGVLALGVALALVVGCTPPEDRRVTTENAAAKKKHDDHSEWWCAEHGIPEHECSMCLPADVVQKQFKDKMDWCELHDRAKSQCFKCDPTLKEKFAAKYRARYNEEPPPIGEEEDEKKDKKN